ncbi:TPA: MmcQ/YjbR family DNA-binding protein, partial [Pseudomonas aeruginosa]
MTADQIAAFCLQLPGAREDLKWGSNRVFSVAGNKMFAILDFVDKDGGLAFKVG